MKNPALKNLTIAATLVAVLTGVWALDDRYDQGTDVKSNSGAITATNVALQQHVYADLTLVINRIESKAVLTDGDKEALMFYRMRRDNIKTLLDGLNK